jgi:hypothetical protein
MDNELAVVYVADDAHQAHLVKNLLAEHDIEAYIHNDQSAMGSHVAAAVYHGGYRAIRDGLRVIVYASDAEEALRIIADAELARGEGRSSPELWRLEDEADRGDDPWPACPSCRRRRHTSCPVCETAGTEFPRAFLPEEDLQDEADEDSDKGPSDDRRAMAGGARKLLVICPTCDEPFEPRFPARCEWCGYRFADGWEFPPPPPYEPTRIDVRVITVVVGLVLTALAIALFFMSLLEAPAR